MRVRVRIESGKYMCVMLWSGVVWRGRERVVIAEFHLPRSLELAPR